MSDRDMRSLLKIMMQHQQKQAETLQKQESRIRLLEEQKKELEFLNAMLSDRLTLAQKKNGLALPVKNTRRVMSSWAFLTMWSKKRIRTPRNRIWKVSA